MKIACSECGASNNSNNNYCDNCGQPLPIVCSACDFKNTADAKFCGACGCALGKNNTDSSGERRQLTVMFCDLVGSSELAEEFDPEEMRDLLRAYQKCVSDVAQQFGGHIAKYIGDGVLIYFGHPNAHEDDAQRSVLTGLGILDGMTSLNKTIRDLNVELKVRMGVHTGLVVVGEMGSGELKEENAIVGETPNIAARIEHIAGINMLAISQDTYELVKGRFVVESLGKKSLKGVSQDIEVYNVLEESNFLSEFDVRYRQGFIPMLGRSRELDFLTDCWNQTKKGIGQIVWLSGEAGVGKSRVIAEFMERVSEQPQHLRLYNCSSIHTNTAFYPIVSYLKYVLNADKNESNEKKYKRLDALFQQYQLPFKDFTKNVAPLLGIQVDHLDENQTKESPENIKKMIVEAWVGLMIRLSEDQPLLLIFEDCHWIDPTTQELITIISEKLAKRRIFLLLTSRPNYSFEVNKEQITQSITLNRLDYENTLAMISHLAGERTLPDELMKQLAEKSDGIPLYIEEITKTVIDSPKFKQKDKHFELSEPLSSLLIPKTLKDSLMARLDQLTDVKKIAQIASIIGRVFSIDLLKSLSIDDEAFIDQGISQLQQAKLIDKADKSDDSVFQFRHALLQETAYESLLKSTRKEYHGKIATALVNDFSESVKQEPEVTAFHFTQAGDTKRAIKYWIDAGMRANITSSHNEAISHFTTASELLSTLQESKEVLEQEFQVQVRLISPLIAAQSYVSPLVEKAFTRALELSKKIKSSPEIFPVLHGRYAFYQVCGLINKAESLVDEFYELADNHKENSVTLDMVGCRLRGSSAIMMGKGELAINYLTKSVGSYDYKKHAKLNMLYGQDIKVSSLAYLGLSYWHQGQLSKIKDCTNDAVEIANKVLSANTVGISHIVSRVIPLVLLDDPKATIHACDEALEAAIRLETPLWKVASLIYKGWALVRMGSALGKEQEGMQMLEQSVAGYNSMKLGLFRPLVINLYAQACMEMGLVVKGLDALKSSYELSQAGGEHWLDAETHRLKGELLLSKPDPEPKEALQAFKLSLELSQKQSSITQELRTLISMYNYYSDTENTAQLSAIKVLLSQVVGQFTAEDQCKDLSIARDILSKKHHQTIK